MGARTASARSVVIPTSPARLLDAAAAHHQTGQLDIAESLYRQVLDVAPGNPEALHRLGALTLQRGDPAAGAELIGKAVRKKPRDVRMLCNLGIAYRMMGLIDEAEAHYRKACAFGRDDADAHAKLGLTQFENGKPDDALKTLAKAEDLAPGRPDIPVTLARVQMAGSGYTEALASCDRALAAQPDHVDALLLRGRILLILGRAAESLEDNRRAVALAPANPVAQSALGQAHKAAGQSAESERHLREAIRLRTEQVKQNVPGALTMLAGAWLDLSQVARLEEGSPDIAEMQGLRAHLDDDDPGALQLHFAIARALWDAGDRGTAFTWYREANALKRAAFEFDIDEARAALAAMPTVFENLAPPPPGDGDAPVFIIGMPRSGTTLLEQILAGHPALGGVGELPYLRQIALRMSGKPFPPDEATVHRLRAAYLDRAAQHTAPGLRPVDKALNFEQVGLIRLLFPDSPIVHIRRDPVDCCLSCFRHLFAQRVDFCYDLRELGLYYNAYLGLMNRWQEMWPDAIHELRYEDLVGDTEAEVRRLLDFCGLPWDDGCLDFHSSGRTVLTASATQVRQGIYDTAIGVGRDASVDLSPLIEALAENA